MKLFDFICIISIVILLMSVLYLVFYTTSREYLTMQERWKGSKFSRQNMVTESKGNVQIKKDSQTFLKNQNLIRPYNEKYLLDNNDNSKDISDFLQKIALFSKIEQQKKDEETSYDITDKDKKFLKKHLKDYGRMHGHTVIASEELNKALKNIIRSKNGCSPGSVGDECKVTQEYIDKICGSGPGSKQCRIDLKGQDWQYIWSRCLHSDSTCSQPNNDNGIYALYKLFYDELDKNKFNCGDEKCSSVEISCDVTHEKKYCDKVPKNSFIRRRRFSSTEGGASIENPFFTGSSGGIFSNTISTAGDFNIPDGPGLPKPKSPSSSNPQGNLPASDSGGDSKDNNQSGSSSSGQSQNSGSSQSGSSSSQGTGTTSGSDSKGTGSSTDNNSGGFLPRPPPNERRGTNRGDGMFGRRF